MICLLGQQCCVVMRPGFGTKTCVGFSTGYREKAVIFPLVKVYIYIYISTK